MPESNDLQPVRNTGSVNYNLEPAQVGNVRDFRPRGLKWVKAASALAGGATAAEAAAAAGVTRKAIYRWASHPGFKLVQQRYLERIERDALTAGTASKVNRLRRLNSQANRIERVMDERGDAMKGVVAGGGTGLITHDQKMLGAGPLAQVVDVYEFDAALSREYRGVLEQAAKEVGGQFDEGAASGPGTGVAITINFPVISAEQLEAVQNAPVIDLPPMARRLLSRPSDGQQR